nr:dTDP-4-amino-4,6-dideoxyglucose formyltransferase [uncultured Desulfobacter sp.]
MTIKKTLILTDNPYAYSLALELDRLHGDIDVYQSPNGPLKEVYRLNVHAEADMLIDTYDLIISIHCKQLFPKKMIDKIRCVNVHPGLNPYNRGWFPQVFSIINGLPCGVTIHEIDEKLDHGGIIIQKKYNIEPWDTSGSAYAKILSMEKELLLEWFTIIRDKKYQIKLPNKEGNINYKSDFDSLKLIDLNQKGTFGEFINRLRALTHSDFQNAYFIDDSGRKIFIKVDLKPEESFTEIKMAKSGHNFSQRYEHDE